MRTASILSVAFAALGLGGLAGAFVTARNAPPAEAPPDARLATSLRAIASDLETVKRRLESLEQPPVAAQRIEAPRPARAEAPAAAEPRAADPAVEKAAALAAAVKELAPKFEKLALAGVPEADLKQVLAEVAASGQQDAAVAALKALLEAHPRDPKLHYLLAKACYARLLLESAPAGFQKWGAATIGAWDEAIALDPAYWEPRFERAEYLTYYPESQGKTPETIAEFEKLIAQQGGSTADPRYAKSYAHLSRMYLRVGKRGKAIQTLRDGVALFPDDQELKRQLDVLEQE